MHSKADFLLGVAQPKPKRPKPLRPLLKRTPAYTKPPHFRGAKSGFKGVIRVAHSKTRPWKAYLRHHGQYVTIGYFATREDAAQAYNRMAVKLFGPTTFLNKV